MGNIKAKALKIETIKLPTIAFLHGLEEENSDRGSIEIVQNTNNIAIELPSPLTSHLYSKAENLINLYKLNRQNIPIVITVIANGKSKKIRIELSWDTIQINKLEDDHFGNLFEVNLNEITIPY
ncbi:hypothetical protein [Olleya sp. Bg11-27]|uniref:hypothetical protein n=1 Tax=Olleya sp. Bg11-27 TaxID=2058135 RepID=UPI0012FD7B2A|nr:hypothetical protein [Olleya sp. Bg11-27]